MGNIELYEGILRYKKADDPHRYHILGRIQEKEVVHISVAPEILRRLTTMNEWLC